MFSAGEKSQVMAFRGIACILIIHGNSFIKTANELTVWHLFIGINSFDDILRAFSECTFLNAPQKLRLTTDQVMELDTFTCKTLRKRQDQFAHEPATGNPFMRYVEENNLSCCSEPDSVTATIRNGDGITSPSRRIDLGQKGGLKL
jgi:hypothetical protein